MTPEAHKYAAAAGSFCFVTTENGAEPNIYKLTTIPGVQRSLCLDEVIDKLNSKKELTVKPETLWNAVWPPVEKPQERESRRNPVHEKKHQPSKCEDTTSSLLKRNTSGGNPGLTMRTLKPRSYVTRRWVLTIKTDKQSNFLRAKARWALQGFQDKQKDYLQTDSPASTRPGFRMSCQMAASRSWDLFPHLSQNSLPWTTS